MASLPAALSILTGLMLGLGAYTFHFAQGLSYFSNDPEACANCHVMRDYLDSWQKSGHHGWAVCNDCHTPRALPAKLWTKLDNGWNHSVKFTLQNFAEPLRLRPVNLDRLLDNCRRCHAGLVQEVGGECLPCHAGVGHGPRN